MASKLYPEVVCDEIYFEINKAQYPVFISLENKYRGVEILKDQGIKKDLDIQAIRKLLIDILTEGMYSHDVNGNRTSIKDEFKEVKQRQVDAIVAKNLTDLWNLFLEKGELVSKEKADELKSKLAEKEAELKKNLQAGN
jgi:hypothetical protein